MGSTPTTPLPEHLGLPDNINRLPGVDPREYMQLLLTQQNPQGMTSMQPGMQPQPPIQRPQMQQPQLPAAGAYGVGEAGAAKRQAMQNTVQTATSLANTITEAVNAKKQRSYQQTLGNFMQLTQGLQQAQGQIQQGQQLVQQAQQRLQQNPDDPAGKQMLQMGQQMMQRGQQAVQQNTTNLNDLSNDSKQHKILSKAFGIDDKNANSPERQALIQMMQKQNDKLSSQSASLMSRLPMTQQLSPEAQAQAQMMKAGVVGKPLSADAALRATTTLQKTGMEEAGKDKRAEMRTTVTAAMNGLHPDGTPLSQEEIAKNPVLSAKVGLNQARTEVAQAQAQLDAMRTSALPEQLKMQEAKVKIAEANLGMRQKEFGIKVQEEERKQLETAAKIGEASTITTPDGQSIDISQFTGGRPLQSWAQQTVVQTQDRLQQVRLLKQKIEDLKLQDNNQSGYLAISRLGYAMGHASDEGSLAAEISNIELQKVTNAAQILKGSSRAYAALSQAMIHTPNAWTDSPKLMYQKLQTIENNLNDMQRDAIQYGQKGERSGEMPHAPAKPASAAPVKPSAPATSAPDDLLHRLRQATGGSGGTE